jgi:hypothetical protein
VQQVGLGSIIGELQQQRVLRAEQDILQQRRLLIDTLQKL